MKVRLKHQKLGRIIATSSMSQNRWALKLGLSRGHLSDLVNGRHLYPSARTRRKLLQRLDLEFDELFEIELPEPQGKAKQTRGRSPAGGKLDSAGSGPAARGHHVPSDGLLLDRPFSNSVLGTTSPGEGAGSMTFSQFRQSLRSAFTSATFALGVILTLALGIGCNTAIFSVISGVLLHPLHFPEAQQLMLLSRTGDTEADLSVPDGVDLRSRSTAFQDIALFLPFWQFDLVQKGRPERLIGSVVEPRIFKILGTRPLRGRVLREADNRPGAERVVVIGSGLWKRRFGRDPGIVGRKLILNDHPVTIVGVVASETDFLQEGVQLWTPVEAETPDFEKTRGSNNFEAIGRLKPGVSVSQASTQLEAITQRLAGEYPKTNQGKILQAVPLREWIVGSVRPFLLLLLGAVGLVLLIVCVNLANLQLVRSTRRAGEIGLRLALGGTRRGVVGQLLIETGILISIGGFLGALLADIGTRLLISWAPPQLPRVQEIGLDWRVLLFATGLTVTTLLVVGFLPALQSSNANPASLLRAGMRSLSERSRQRLLNSFVVAEVALAFVLLVGAGLILRSLVNLQGVDLGFNPSRRLSINLVLPASRYGKLQNQTRAFQQILDRLQALPGVRSAAFVIGAPMRHWGAIGHRLDIKNHPLPEPGKVPSARNRPVLGNYFSTAGIRVIKGRALNGEDTATTQPVAVVNQAFVRQSFPDEDPIGKQIAWRLGSGSEDQKVQWMTIVGVVSDIKIGSLQGPDDPSVYTPYLQRLEGWQRFGTFVLDTRGEQTSLAEAIRQAVWSVDPTVPVPDITSLESLVSAAMARQRYVSWVLGLFSLIALAMALQGVYALLSYIVVQRRGEIGIRMALGARRADVLKLFLGRGLLLALTGIAGGLLGSLALIRFISSLLFGVASTDPLTYTMVGLGLLAAALAACYLPALRASTVDPMRTLRVS